jgi:transcription-repair coupling factor (superfamily II helicase)
MMFATLELQVGKTVNLSQLVKKLFDFGYSRVESVSERGDFSQRGGIVDVYPWTHDSPLRVELIGDKIGYIQSFNIFNGKGVSNHQKVILLPQGKIDIRWIKRKRFELGEVSPIRSFFDIRKGDYVVHINYGIGRYLGVEKLKTTDNLIRNHLVIEYAGRDRLYVPLSQKYLVRKYVGLGRGLPRLHRLNTKDWQRTKVRAARAIGDLARGLLELEAKRKSREGFRFSSDTDWQKELESFFEYEETPDQCRTTVEVKKDMESATPMDRLLCGDVGYGKTEVALRAAFKAVMDNKQVAILVPTTILAEQHFRSFYKRLRRYPVNIQVLSRFKSRREQKDILNGLSRGQVDIIIGTHRLLSADVKFHDLGLLIIDEEQRFGVAHKERLKLLRELVDVLTLTATPIPRTLYMSLVGIKDISVINTPPQKRIPIETYVEFYEKTKIKKAILRELDRNGQVYFVHNRIEGINKVEENLRSLLPPQVSTIICHGQMPEKELSRRMVDFIDGKIDILISTSIIESGLDIPNVNTIIVNRADMFGLADLYQLRGRVGRFTKEAYAYFLIPRNFILTVEARKRLEAISKFTELGSGFKIATEDLEIRGAGNILGPQQHGWVIAIGLDLYCEILKEAIEQIKTAKKGNR